MGGPKTTRSNVDTAPVPGLGPDIEQLLKSFIGGQMPNWAQPSALQQNVGNAFANQLAQPTAASRTYDLANPFITDLLKQTPGKGVLDAAVPVFQRNQQFEADKLRQAGPRFNSNTERLIAEQGNKAMDDFNLFSQKVMQEGLDRQLKGLDIFGNLATGADKSILDMLSGAGDFANNQQIGQNSVINALIALLSGTGTGPAALNHDPGAFQNVLNAGSTAAQLYINSRNGNQRGGFVPGIGGVGSPSPFGQGGGYQ